MSHEKYWKIQLAKFSSKQWYEFLKCQQKNFQFEIVADLPSSTIKKITNLKNVSGMLNRMASQLIIWKDSKIKFKNFQKTLKTHMNGTINEGGRFIQISSPCNKRIAQNYYS